MAFRKYFVPLVIFGAFALGTILYRREVATPVRSLAPTPAAIAHVYKSPDKNITKIRIKAFYVVPKNKIGQVDLAWREKLSVALDDTARFHNLQFRGLSKLEYDIFPEPIILKNDGEVYDTTSTSAGNPHGLINIGEEVEARVFKSDGDLYNKNFSAIDPSAHRVMGFLYEGVGASGGLIYEINLKSPSEIAEKIGVPESVVYIVQIESADGFFMVNRNYLVDPVLKTSGSSIFYHEFAHTIGLPDTFDSESGPRTTDIMGTGRYKPIEYTYIDRSFLKEMGVQ